MSREIITQMVRQTSSGGVWKAVTKMFSSQSKAHVVQLRTQLNKAHKENKTAEVYFVPTMGGYLVALIYKIML
jgi:pantothenate synthetase